MGSEPDFEMRSDEGGFISCVEKRPQKKDKLTRLHMISEKTPAQDFIKEEGIKSVVDVLGLIELIILKTDCG